MKRYCSLLLLVAALPFGMQAQVPTAAEDICPLLIGESMPNATLRDGLGREVDLLSTLDEKPAVLVFYRGGWCPFCNKQLAALATTEQTIKGYGFQLIAITPEAVENLEPTEKENNAGFTLLSDPDGQLIQKMGIAFATNEKTLKYMDGKTQGTPSTVLPVPTVMVVSTKGEILFSYINTDYKTRISEEMLLAVLKSIR
jgi:peroxiredoxin